MNSLTGWLTIVNLAILIGGAIGVYVAIRSSLASTSNAIQERVRQALHDENEVLQSRIKRVETQYKRMERLLELIAMMLKKRGIEMEIEGDVVTLRDQSGTHTSRLPTTNGQDTNA